MTRKPDVETLSLFLDVVATGSISKAARRHLISQPAASKRLEQLELTLGVTLIERSRTGSSLTAQGQAVVDWAGRVVTEVDHLMEAVKAFHSPATADLTIAASLTIAEHLVPNWLSQLRRTEPRVHVSLSVKNSHEVQELVYEGVVDLGLVETTVPDDRLKSQVIARDSLTVVVAPTHPWARKRRGIRAVDLAKEQLIVRETGSGTRETLDRVLHPYAPVAPLLELGSNAAVRGAVREGAGAAVLSMLAVEEAVSSGHLVAVEVHGIDLGRPLTALWRRSLTGPARMLLACARSASGQRRSQQRVDRHLGP